MVMEVIVKKSQPKIDPKFPESSDPSWERRRKVGERRIKEGKFKKFENEAEERDYSRKVGSNPSNVPGIPVFYPPLTIRSAMNGLGIKHDCAKVGHRWSNTKESFCLECDVDKELIN
jgi:hypothetical protein